MTSMNPHRKEIKAIIEELQSQTVDLKQLREALIGQIRSNQNHAVPGAGSSQPNHEQKLDGDTDRSDAEYELIQRFSHCVESLRRLDLKIIELQRLLAPMQYLPDELLIMIFREGCKGRRPEPDRCLPFPMLTASVSRRWRALTCRIPILWTNLHLAMAGPRYWASLALERSGDRLIDIAIDGRVESTSGLLDIAITEGETEASIRTPTIITYMEQLLPHAKRWHKFSIISHHSVDVLAVGDLLQNVEAPFLEVLRVSLTGSGPAGNQELVLSPILLGGAPNLHTVRLDSVALPWSNSPLAGLLTIDIRWMWDSTKLLYAELRDLIAASPTLQRLILRGRHVELRPSATYEPIPIPSLRYLELSGDNICQLASILITPNLETLALVNVDESEFREFVWWLSKADVKYSALRYLIFVNVTTCDLSSQFTEAFPAIGQLSIINSHADNFVELLNREKNADDKPIETIIWQSLKTIVLIDDVNYDRLAHMVCKRAGQKFPLGRLILNGIFTKRNEEKVWPLMEHVRVDGISVLEGDI